MPYLNRVKNINLNAFQFALVSFFFAALAIAVNRSWEFNPYGWVDHWAYFGNEHFSLAMRKYYPTDPSGDLLPVLLPSYIINHVFSPVLAQYIRAFIYLGLTNWLLMVIVDRKYKSLVALTTGGIFLGSQYSLTALGTTYPAGTVMLYLTASIYFTTFPKGHKNARKHLFLKSFLSGIFLFLAFYSAILVLIYIPAYLFLHLMEIRKFRDIDKKSKLLLTAAGFFSSFLTVSILLQCIYSMYGTGFFFTNNIGKLFGFTVGNAYRAPAFNSWLPFASWLVIPAGTVFATVIFFIISCLKKEVKIEFDFAYQAFIVLIFGSLVVTNLFVHQWSLQFMYFTQTQTIFFIGLSGIIATLLNCWISFKSYLIPTAIFAVSLFSLGVAERKNYTFQTLGSTLLGFLGGDFTHPLRFLVVWTLLLTILYVCALYSKIVAMLCIAVVVTTNIFSFSPTFGCFACFNSFASKGAFSGISSSEDNFSKSVKVADTISTIDPYRVSKIWYNELEPLGPLYRQVNAIYYLNEGGHRVSKSFPSLSDSKTPIGSGGSSIIAGDSIVILSEQNMVGENALTILSNMGFRPHLEKTLKVSLSLDTSVYIVLVKLK